MALRRFIHVLLGLNIACMLYCLPLSAALHKLNLQKKTMFVGGSFTPIYKLTGFSQAQNEFSLLSTATAGYFIADRLAIGASLPIRLTIHPWGTGDAGISLFSTYFFDIKKTFYPYVGGDLTFRYGVGEKALLLSAGANAGILLGLSENIALDLGIAPEFYIPLNNRQKWKLELPAGFIGLRAFFRW